MQILINNFKILNYNEKTFLWIVIILYIMYINNKYALQM